MKHIITRFAAIAALIIPGAAFAGNLFNVTTSSCSGSLVSSSTDGLSLACTGDYLLSGGSIVSDKSISLSASGVLTIQDVSFNAPIVTLGGGTALIFNGERAWFPVDGDVNLDGMLGVSIREAFGGGRSIQLTADGITATIPEPGSFALMLGGMAAMGLACRRKTKA